MVDHIVTVDSCSVAGLLTLDISGWFCILANMLSSWLDEYSHFSCKKTIIKVTFFPLDSQSRRSSAPGKGRHHRKLIVPVGLTQSEAAYVVSQQSDTDEITKLGVLDDTKPSGTIRVNEHAWRSV